MFIAVTLRAFDLYRAILCKVACCGKAVEADSVLAEQIPSFSERHGTESTAFTERMRQLVNDTPSGRVSCRRIECRVCDIRLVA